MQHDLVPEKGTALIVKSEPIELVVSEGGGSRLSLVLPPWEDLAEIEKVSGRNFSLRDFAEKEWAPFKAAFSDEFMRLKRKMGRFETSKTYFAHLANLAELAGERNEELRILSEMPESLRDNFSKFRIGENYQATGRLNDAEAVFRSLDQASDTAASLRVAFFHARRGELDEAGRIVARVLAIDPLDYGARLFEGGLRIAAGKFQQAIQSFRIAEDERPTSSVLATNLAIAYVCSKKNEKALAVLRKAVALDPLNEVAVSLLADVANQCGKDEEAVPALRYYVSLEQRQPAIWGRLARALVRIGNLQEALASLQRQASQDDSAAVWNNIGVVRGLSGKKELALSAFKHAVSKMTDSKKFDGLVAVRNTLGVLVDQKHYDDVVRFANIAIDYDEEGICKRDRRLGDIYSFMLHSMRNMDHGDEAASVSEGLLKDQSISRELRIWIASQLLAYYSIVPKYFDRAISLGKEYLAYTNNLAGLSEHLHEGFINNLTFAFAERGMMNEAESLMAPLSKYVHRKAYPTATLGLVHLRKGRIDTGTSLYNEAVSLAVQKVDKRRIRQKLNLELGLLLQKTEPRKAQRLLQKVATEPDGAPELKQLARLALLSPVKLNS